MGASRARADDRRFTDKSSLDPASVRSLPSGHPALTENRTLFPTTVVTVDESFSDRLLVSGKNNRKLGERILKGKFKGYALYGLSLEERATCPVSCDARAFCYGNGMQMARRHRIADLDLFATFLEDEIRESLAGGVDGLMVRLHVLGDFPSVEYVALWADLLEAYENLACYGYTHRLISAIGGDDIGDAIFALKGRFPQRFRIRWSSNRPMPDGARIIAHVPDKPKITEGLVCPAQTDATACCASCGLCWEGHARHDSIVFIKHGPKSLAALAETILPASEEIPLCADAGAAPMVRVTETVRAVTALSFAQKRNTILSEPPTMRVVDPVTLRVESAYQRDLSGKSMRLIRKIVAEWNWAKFKPPVCAETDDGLFIIDGQHTAIAAASHPEIKAIPVMIVPAPLIERRAEAFVAHNRDRLAMTPAQIFYGDVAAGNRTAKDALEAVIRAGGSIPRVPIQKGYAKPGQIAAVGEVCDIAKAHGPEVLERVVRIAVMAKVAPITKTVLRSLRIIITDERHVAASKSESALAAAVASIKNIEATAAHVGAETGQDRFRACVGLITAAIAEKRVV